MRFLRRYIILDFLLITLIIITGCNSTKQPEQVLTEKIININDKFPISEMVNSNGSYAKDLTSKSKYKIVFYLSKHCSSCKKNYVDIARLVNVVKSNKLSYIILWRDESDTENAVKEIGIPVEANFTLKNNYQISRFAPSFYLLDENNQVIFMNSSVKSIIQKLFELNFLDQESIKESANQYILDTFAKGGTKKPVLVYLEMEGCSDCAEAKPIVFSNEVKNKYNIISISTYDNTDKNKITDLSGIFQQLYGIEWYPSFLIINSFDQYNFIGETPVENLKETLLS